MKYESNILERLIKTYGVVGNPKYVSEIIKQFIIQGKECYPNLFTYQSDWLAHIDEFGLANDYVVTYTGQRFYAPNTKERPVKRVILKGQTLVNIVNFEKSYFRTTGIINSRQGCTINFSTATTGKFNLGGKISLLKTDTKYLLKVKLECENKETTYVYLLDEDNNKYIMSNASIKDNNYSYKFTTPSTLGNTIKLGFIRTADGGEETITASVLLIEYQEGMENWDIPYFEGMQSVNLPVLTTTGKNLFDGIFIHGEIANGVDNDQTKYVKSANYFSIKPNTNYYLTCNDGYNSTNAKIIVWYDSNKNFIAHKNGSGVSPSNACFARIRTRKDDSTTITQDELSNIQAQLEEGSTATTYEPYKSNILTVNEDVELRGIGDVQDTLDCLTGECVNNIEEREFNGSENWSSNGSSGGVYKYYCNTYTDAKGNATTSISDKVEFVNVNGGEPLKGDVCLTHTTSTGKVQFATTINTTANFKAWLKENPVVVQYERANPVTKTVGVIIKDQNNQVVNHLTSFEGGTHFDTSSQTGSLLPTLEVDVVVDLEETLMVCSTEGNTM